MQINKEALEVNKLRRRILFLVLLAVFFTGTITSLSTSLPFYFTASKNLEEITQASLERQVAVIDNLLGKYQDLAKQFTSRTEIKLRLEKYTQGTLTQEELIAYSKPRLADAMQLSNDLLGMKRLGPKGEELVSLGSTPQLVNLENWMDRIDKHNPNPGYCFVLLDNQVAIAVVANIFNKTNEFIGQDLLFFSSTQLQKSLSNQKNTAPDTYIINLITKDKLALDKGKLVLAQEKSTKDLDQLANLKNQQQTFTKAEEVTFFFPLGFDKWNLVTQQPSSLFYAQVKQKTLWPLLALGLMLLLVGYALSRFLQPLTYRLAYQAKELKISTAELRLIASIFEGSSEAIAVTDAEMHLVKLNAAFSEITGYQTKEVLGRNLFTMFFQAKGVSKLITKIQQELIHKASWQGEIWYLNKEGEFLPVLQTISAQLDTQGKVSHYIHIFNDISEHKAFENKINYLAHYDQLTDLPNRTLVNKRLAKALKISLADKKTLCLMFMDLDHFKDVNDKLGHGVGDLLLQAVAERLKNLVRIEDTLGRLGGDEFILILSGSTSKEDAGIIASKIINALTQPFIIEGNSIVIGVSIGIALCPEDATTADNLVKYADRAMYLAKESGRNTYKYFAQTKDA